MTWDLALILLKMMKGRLKMYYTVLSSQIVIIMQNYTWISIFKTANLFLAAVIWYLIEYRGRIAKEAWRGYCWREVLANTFIIWSCNNMVATGYLNTAGNHNINNSRRILKHNKEERTESSLEVLLTFVGLLYSKIERNEEYLLVLSLYSGCV